jgi:hypothetical protein
MENSNGCYQAMPCWLSRKALHLYYPTLCKDHSFNPGTGHFFFLLWTCLSGDRIYLLPFPLADSLGSYRREISRTIRHAYDQKQKSSNALFSAGHGLLSLSTRDLRKSIDRKQIQIPETQKENYRSEVAPNLN